MSKCLEISCIIHSTILNDFCHITHRSTMQIVFPNMQAALDHIEEHKEMEVVIVQSHDGSKADILQHKGKWPYKQFNCIINMKPNKGVKSSRRDPNSCVMKFFVRRALRSSKSDDNHYVIQGNLFHAHHCNPEKIKRVPNADRKEFDIFIPEDGISTSEVKRYDEKTKKDEPIVDPFAQEKINSEELKKLLVKKLESIMDCEQR